MDGRMACVIRFAMVAETDYLIGQVLSAAKARADYANTLVIFLSDL